MMKILTMLNWGLGSEILKTLHSMKGVEVCGVITRHEDKSEDRWINAVYEFGIRNGYRVTDERDIGFGEIKDMIIKESADLLVVHSFMKKIPRDVFSAPVYGSVNIHPSLLPKYRGPSPTQWVLKNKEDKTGLTCHFISEGIDEGDIINQVELPVEKHETFESIIEKQKNAVGPLLKEALSLITASNFKPRPQLSGGASYAPRSIERREA